MSGTIYDELKKNEENRRREKFKFYATILSTNILVAVICLNLTTEGAAVKTSPHNRILHPHFKMIITPLTVIADIDHNAPETPVTLMNKSKKILITKAYLHEDVGGTPARFKIEIPEEEVLKLSADSEELMIAIPEVKMPVPLKKPIFKRVSQYEVSL